MSAPSRLPRLKSRKDFVRAARRGQASSTPGLVLQSVEQSEDADVDRAVSRVGFTASRRVGGAVARNRAKRRLRAVAAAVLPDRAKTGRDYVLIARAATLTRDFDDLLSDLDCALKRLDDAQSARGRARADRKRRSRR